jgi:hypothetical protein
LKTIAAAILGVLAFPLSALAQSEPSLLRGWQPSGTLAQSAFPDDERRAYPELTLGVHVPFLGGDLDDTKTTKWNDLYSSAGGGFEAMYSHLFRVSPVVSVGPYAGFTVDVFGGKTIDFDKGPGVQTYDLDPLAMFRLIFGARIREQWGAFFMDQNIGLGPVVYGSGTASAFFSDDIEIIKSSTNLAFEFGLRLGAVVSRRVDLGLGMTFELNGPPETGKDLQGGPDFRGQANFALTFLINLNF